MVVENHPAWPRIPLGLREMDARLTSELNQTPTLDPGLFDEGETRLIRAYARGDDLNHMEANLGLSHKEFLQTRVGAFEKAGVLFERALVYRACASGIVEYNTIPWTGPVVGSRGLGVKMAILLKARAANRIETDIRRTFWPDSAARMVKNQTQYTTTYFGARNTIHAMARAFEFGLFARDA